MKGSETMAKPKTSAIELENGNYGCPECRGDKLEKVAHMDGRDFFENVHNCVDCGCVVNFKFKRSKKDRMYWE